MMSSRSSFTLVYIITILTYYSAAIVYRKDDIYEDCKIVTQCDDYGTKINTSSFTTVNNETGTVKLILPGRSEIHLKLNARLEGKSCDTILTFPYSVYNCKMKTENVTSECSYQEVTLRYLFSSCYEIYNDNGDFVAIGSVQTNYTRDILEKDCHINFDIYLIQEKYTLISVNITRFFYNSVLKFIVFDSDGTPNATNAEIWWRVEIKENLTDNIIIEEEESENRTVDCSIVPNEEIGLDQLRCLVDWTKILTVKIIREKSTSPIDDSYCRSTDITIEPLRPYEKIDHIIPTAGVLRTTNSMVLMFIPLTALVFYVCLSLYFSDTKDHLLKENGPKCETDSPFLKCKVLLLYPQDCDAFMGTMKSLQIFLQSFNYFEVYDYFDPKRFGEIACDPQGWISKLLTQKDVRIILTETDTALLHQLAIAKKCVVNYVSPLPYSNLFAYGLQNLLHSLRPQEYSRIFLIRFEDMTQDKENLKLSRYERYKLPEHLSNLVSCMSNSNIITFKENEEESCEMKRLKQSIEEFKQFQQHNPDYHAEMCNNLTRLI